MKRSQFLVASGVSQFGSTLTSLALLTMVVSAHGPAAGVWLITFGYLAVALSGLVVGALKEGFVPVSVLRMTELVRGLLLVVAAYFHSSLSLGWIIGIQFILQILEGVYHPYRYRVIRDWLTRDSERASFIASLQSVDSTSSVVGPLLAGLFLQLFSTRWCLWIDAATYLFSFGFWVRAILPRLPDRLLEKQPVWAGYQILYRTRALRYLNLGRITGNIPFIFLNLSLPVLVIRIPSLVAWNILQGIALSLIALGLLMTNQWIAWRAKKLPVSEFEEKVFKLTRFPVLIGIGLFSLFYQGWISQLWIFVGALLFGISNAGFRTGGILLGQRITPPSSLHLVIASSDSVVRLLTALLASLISIPINSGGESFLWMGLLAVVAVLLAGRFYRKAGKMDLGTAKS